MKRKLDVIKSKEKTFPVIDFSQKDLIEETKSVKEAIDNLYTFMNEKEDYDFEKLNKQLELLNLTLDLRPQLHELKKTVEDNKVETVSVKEFGELLKAVKDNKPLPVEIDLTKLEKAIIQVDQRIQESTIPDSQDAEDYTPYRRVIKVGNKLVFDDQPTPSRGGGGSSSGGSTSTGLTDDQLRASPVPVSVSGVATSAKQDTQQTALDAIKTALEVLDNAVSGNELQVDVLTMPTVAVTGTFWQATQPVSISATVTTKETRSSTPTQTSVADTASSTTLIASNANRLGATIYNDSTVALYVKLGGTASTSSFTIKLDPNDYYEIPFGYTGVVDGIWASDASGSARITELAA